MKKIVRIISFLLFLSMPAQTVTALDLGFEFSGGPGYLTGDTTYEIGNFYGDINYQYFPVSRLEFPLKAAMAHLEGDLYIGDKWKLFGKAKTDIYSTGGNMEDSDWLSPGSLDIYSESEANLDAVMLNAGFTYEFYKQSHRKYLEGKYHESSWSFNLGPGYVRQSLDYETEDLTQWSPSGNYPSAVLMRSGKCITYEVDLSFPYLAVGAKSMTETVMIDAALGYSPWVSASDKDVHLFTAKVSEGEADGYAYLGHLNIRFFMPENWFVDLYFDFTNISTEGEQTQRTYAGTPAYYMVEEEITSSQAFAALKIGMRF